jgi:hypothetical protein
MYPEFLSWCHSYLKCCKEEESGWSQMYLIPLKKTHTHTHTHNWRRKRRAAFLLNFCYKMVGWVELNPSTIQGPHTSHISLYSTTSRSFTSIPNEGAPNVTQQTKFSHPNLVISFLETPHIKGKNWDQKIGGRLLIANHLDQS